MPSLNKAMIVGHLGKDPEARDVNGKRIATFSVATSDKWKDKTTGEVKEVTVWHNVVIFNDNKAKYVLDYAKKGSLILVEGKINNRDYIDKDGVKKYTSEIVVSAFDGDVKLFDGSRGDGRDPSHAGTATVQVNKPAATSTTPKIQDSIPF